jgi:hypothetical protein
VPCYQLDQIEKLQKNMRAQDLQELYGGLKPGADLSLLPSPVESRTSFDETEKISCGMENGHMHRYKYIGLKQSFTFVSDLKHSLIASAMTIIACLVQV